MQRPNAREQDRTRFCYFALTLAAENPAQPPVLDGSALPKVADSTNSKDALLTCKGGRIGLENLRITHTPRHGVWAEGVRPLHVRHCVLEDIHGQAIRAESVHEAVIDSCEIKDVDGTGIWVSGGDTAALTPSNSVISNNHVSNVNRWKTGGDSGNGIKVDGVGIAVRQNTVENSVEEPWTMGIRVGGNNHLVERNRLRHVSYGDAGAIYLNGRAMQKRGSVVRFNFIEDCGSGVYVDDRACGHTITGNLILSTKRCGIMIGGGQDNIVTNNFVALSTSFLHLDNRGMSWASQQHRFKDDWTTLQAFLANPATRAVYLKTYPALANLKAEAALIPANNVMADNYADRDSAGIKYFDMDKLMGGKHAQSYERWNKIKQPRPLTFSKNHPFDFARLGAPGLTADKVGAQPVSAGKK